MKSDLRRLSDRMRGLKESQIRDMTRLALRTGAINLSQGYPDFDPPPRILEAAERAIAEGANQYTITWGIPELRRAVAEYWQRRFSPHFDWVDPEIHVTITCGVTEAIADALMAAVNPRDEVLILEPAHENYLPAVRFAGGAPVPVPLAAPDFQLDPERLERAITPRARAVILNTPQNPTGRVFTWGELEGLAALCERYDLLAVTDEIYERILFDGREHVPPASLPGMRDRTVTIGGFGKTYAVTGWRLGFAIAPEDWSRGVRAVHDFTTICAPAPLQQAAIAALGLPESYYQEQVLDYQRRRDLLLEGLAASGFNALRPEGAYYALADFAAWRHPEDSDAFARWLTREVGVAVVGGTNFYADPKLGSRVVRFAFAKKLETLELARARLEEGFRRRHHR